MKLSSFLTPLLLLGLFLALVVAGFLISGPGLKFQEPERRGQLALKGETFAVEVVADPLRQAEGLSGRTKLAGNEGMLFVFDELAPRKITMKGMLTPIDIIWIKGNTIIGLEKEVKPDFQGSVSRIYFSPEPVDKVLEVKAGTVGRLGIEVGDQVVLSYN